MGLCLSVFPQCSADDSLLSILSGQIMSGARLRDSAIYFHLVPSKHGALDIEITFTSEACKKRQVKCKIMFLCQANRVTQSLVDVATENVYFLVAKLSNCRRITVFLSISASVVCCQCRQIDGSSEPQHNKVTPGFIFISRNDKYFHFQNYKYFCTSNTLTFVSDTEYGRKC